MLDFTVPELVRKIESDDQVGTTQIGKYVSYNQRENIDTIDAYLNSKHTSGEVDSQGREKPFFNIVTAATNIWFRATDIDRKQIKIKATKGIHYKLSLLATIHLQEWMRKTAFGQFLNDWGRSLARYGSTILKFVEKDGELHSEVMPWDRMLVDPVDFDNNPQIEKIWLTPAQLLKRDYDQDHVKKLIDAVEIRETPEGQDKDTKSEYIPIYEIHGEMPLAYLTDKEADEDDYVQQMHVISFIEKKDGTFDDYTLASGRESKSPYVITHLIKEEGRTQGIGAVEHLFQSQWMHNHTAKAIKDQLDLASKLIFQTSDGSFVGQSALSSIESGDILVHRKDEPLTQVNNQSTDIAALQAFGQQWRQQANESTGISEAMLGASPKSGTAWRQTEALLMESHSLFEIMTENKGLYLENILREYVIPHLKKKMNTSEEISATLEEHQIREIDSKYLPNKVKKVINQKIKNAILSGKTFTQEEKDIETEIQTDNLKNMLASLGGQRFIKPSEVPTKTWKEVLKDLEWDVEVGITGEQKNIQAALTTLTNVFQTLANPTARDFLQTDEGRLLFNRILETAGNVSPVELSSIQPSQPQQQPQQQQQITPPATPAGRQQLGGVGAGQ